MPPAEKGMFEWLLSPALSPPLPVVPKVDALNGNVLLTTGVLNIGGRLILLNELTIDTSVMVGVGILGQKSSLNGQLECSLFNQMQIFQREEKRSE